MALQTQLDSSKKKLKEIEIRARAGLEESKKRLEALERELSGPTLPLASTLQAGGRDATSVSAVAGAATAIGAGGGVGAAHQQQSQLQQLQQLHAQQQFVAAHIGRR